MHSESIKASILKKVNPSEQPILVLSIQSQTMPIWKLNKYIDNFIVPQITMLPGQFNAFKIRH